MAILDKVLREESKHLEREQRSKSVRKREKLEEIEGYLGLPSIEPPTLGNSKAHETNRL